MPSAAVQSEAPFSLSPRYAVLPSGVTCGSLPKPGDRRASHVSSRQTIPTVTESMSLSLWTSLV